MSKTLLLADDSVTIQKVVGISFASEDIRIVTVDNGDAAVAKARELRPDVVLADVVMPGLSGYEVCEALKADPALRHVPVILLTGTFEAFDEERASRAGAAGHVAKPFEAQTLVDRVKELLAAPKAPAPDAPAPQAAAAPAASGGVTDAAFDFFGDDDLPAADFSAEADAGEPLDFDEPDGAFAFGDDDLSDLAPEPRPAPPLAPPAPPDAILPDAPGAGGDDFDFATPEADDARGALFEPVGSSFDVSSSDLAPERDAAEAHDPSHTRVLDPSPAAADTDPFAGDDDFPMPGHAEANEPAPAFPPDPVLDLLRREPRRELAAEPFDAPPAADPFDGADDADPYEAPAAAEPLEAPDPFGRADDPFDRTGDVPRPFGATPDPEDDADAADPWSVEAEPEDEADPALPDLGALEPEPDDAPIADASADDAAPAGLSPALHAEIRDTLERIAWDALGPVTEKIVRQALERIEQVAWEVVPKLAETLIQEEIRRLKGDAEE